MLQASKKQLEQAVCMEHDSFFETLSRRTVSLGRKGAQIGIKDSARPAHCQMIGRWNCECLAAVLYQLHRPSPDLGAANFSHHFSVHP